MSKEVISQTEGLAKAVVSCVRDAYDRGYKQGYKDGELLRDAEYVAGLNKAWECARKIADNPQDKDLCDCFGTTALTIILKKYSASEVVDKIKEHEKRKKQPEEKQDDIEVGDEVITNAGLKAIVTKTRVAGKEEKAEKYAYILFNDGSAGEFKKDILRRTGKHFDELPSIFQQMRGEWDVD